MTSLPEFAALSALGLSPEEAATAIENGLLDPPFEVHPGVYLFPRRSIVAYLAAYGKGLPRIAHNASKPRTSRGAGATSIGLPERA